MSKNQKTAGGFSSLMASIAIVISLVIGVLIYMFIFGDKANFVDGLQENEVVAEGVQHYFGLIHKGGFIVPMLVAILIIVIVFPLLGVLIITLLACSICYCWFRT